MPDNGLGAIHRNMAAFIAAKHAALVQAGHEVGAVLEAYAKANHPWTPQTGATDASTRGYVSEVTPRYVTVALTAGMDYNVFLELAHDGKWAWLYPAVEANADQIVGVVEKRMRIGAAL